MPDDDETADAFGISRHDYVLRWLRAGHESAREDTLARWADAYLATNRELMDVVVDIERRVKGNDRQRRAEHLMVHRLIEYDLCTQIRAEPRMGLLEGVRGSW